MSQSEFTTDALKLIILTTSENSKLSFFDSDPDRSSDYYAARWLGQQVRIADRNELCTGVAVIGAESRWRR